MLFQHFEITGIRQIKTAFQEHAGESKFSRCGKSFAGVNGKIWYKQNYD
ncbi:MAG: hypothetical protein GY874_14085 [Desulfobacteraceae bacterium]|nr:hypothetical protein [Desulfobacteraceae bacterium]